MIQKIWVTGGLICLAILVAFFLFSAEKAHDTYHYGRSREGGKGIRRPAVACVGPMCPPFRNSALGINCRFFIFGKQGQKVIQRKGRHIGLPLRDY